MRSQQTSPLIHSGLSEQERAEALRVANRLREELYVLLQAFPPTARSAAGMAKHLGIGRSSCQNLLSTLGAGLIRPGTLTQIAGVASLESITQAAKDRGTDAASVSRFESAVNHFKFFLQQIGGSQRVLAKRLLHTDESVLDSVGGTSAEPAVFAPPRASVHESDLSDEEQLFKSAKNIVGCWAKTQLMIHIVAPGTLPTAGFHYTTIGGLIGHVVRWGAPPWAPQRGTTLQSPKFNTVDGGEIPQAAQENLLVPEFCSSPTPTLSSYVREGRLCHVVDQAPNVPVDVIFASSMSNVSRTTVSKYPRSYDVWTVANRPVEALLFDVFIHRDYATTYTPNLDLHLSHVLIGVNGEDTWSTRMPNKPALKHLGLGLGQTRSSLYTKQPALLAHMFKRSNLDPEEFVGYRCEVQYPVWRMSYRMWFAQIDRPESATDSGPSLDHP